MQPAALGLACKESMEIFSHNETLRLQRENKELRARLDLYEPGPRKFSTRKEYLQVESEAMEFLFQWIHNNTKANGSVSLDYYGLYYGNGCADFLNHIAFMDVLRQSIYMIAGDHNLANRVAWQCRDLANAALQAAYYLDNISSDAPGMWSRNQKLVADIVCRSLIPDKIPELISQAVEYPEKEW